MEKMTVYRDYQEVQTSDLNNTQIFTRQSLDDLVNDAVTRTLRYSGFTTVKSNTAEITVSPGRFYGANGTNQIGAVFTLPTTAIIGLVQYLAVSTRRILVLSAYGIENEVSIETRDYLTNVTTLQTEPKAVGMVNSRDAVLSIVAGAEGADPQPPSIGSTQVAIAQILLDSAGVVSVTMLPAGLVTSTEDLDSRLDIVEVFDALIGPRVQALAADLADLANRISRTGNMNIIIELMQDMSEVKTKVGLPATYAQYGADYFLWPDPSSYDTNNTASLGYSALIENGIRFPAQNASLGVLAIFNPIDPNANYNANGLLLPAYDSTLKLKTGAQADAVTIGQYGYQTFDYKQLDIPYSRLRYGGSYFKCTNGVTGTWDPATGTPAWWLPNFATYEVHAGSNYDFYHGVSFDNYLWYDTWTEPYWTLESVPHSVNGALVAQSFLVSSDTWITRLGIFLTSVASQTNIGVILAQCTGGQPDLTKTLAVGTLTGASLKTGMNYLELAPTFAAKGDRLAVILYSSANHGLGLAAAGSYLGGSFFYSLDGTYYLGDFTKEMVLEVWGATFRASQTTIELNAFNLQGGIRAIDLTARTIIPGSCQLVFEVMPDGTGEWLPVKVDPTNPIAPFPTAPVLCRFRARFVGTPDIMPGIKLPDSILKIWCPGPSFTYVSEPRTLAAPSTNVTVKIRVEHYDTVAHTIGVKLYYGGPPLVVHNPTATTVTLLDASTKAYEVIATFVGIPSTSTFIININGTTNSVANVFHVAQALWWAL
jgi:hypothetical protein